MPAAWATCAVNAAGCMARTARPGAWERQAQRWMAPVGGLLLRTRTPPSPVEGPTAANAAQTTDEQRDRLRQISDNDEAAIADVVAIRVAEAVDASGFDARTFALVNLAALIGVGGDESSYLMYVTAALDAGASVDEITDVLTAVGPNVGVFKMVAAGDPLATALGIHLAATSIDEGDRGGDTGERQDDGGS